MSHDANDAKPEHAAAQDGGPPDGTAQATRYLSSEGWQHIFVGNRAELTRWVFDTESDHFVFAQVQAVRGWSNIRDRWMLDDLRADLSDNGVLDSVRDRAEHDVLESDKLPQWAQGAQQHGMAEGSAPDAPQRSMYRERGG